METVPREASCLGRDQTSSAHLELSLVAVGWRLPTINELASLFDPAATAAPGLPSGHPFTGLGLDPVEGDSFWSATPILGTADTSTPHFAAVLYGRNPLTGVFQISMNFSAPLVDPIDLGVSAAAFWLPNNDLWVARDSAEPRFSGVFPDT